MNSNRDTTSHPDSLAFLSGGGEMGERIRMFDWANTPLGPISGWSPALRTMLGILLANRFPHILWWGSHYIQFYNDPYRPVLGTKHPNKALGQPASECWAEIWHVIGPLIDRPFNGGPATWDDDIYLEINRHGFVEECHFTIAYSPVPDETAPNGIGGVLATVHEITGKVVGDRRVLVLRDLGSQSAEARTAEDACAIATRTLANHSKDIPFALLYLIDHDRKQAHLAGSVGIAEEGLASSSVIPLEGNDASNPLWPLRQVMRSESVRIVKNLPDRFGDQVPPGPWTDRPQMAAVVPIRSNKAHYLAGFLVAGISARLQFDQSYQDFLELVSSQIATAIANAREYEEEKKRAEALAEIDRAKTAFFSNVSHEFRTPLTLMLGPVEDLLATSHTGLSPAAKGQLEVVDRNGLRLLRLVNTLLDFSRIEAGRVQAVFEPTDLATFTTDLTSSFRAATERAGIRLLVNCPRLSEPVYVDRDMWEKIVLNLVSNAFKFTFEGEIEVSLRTVDGVAELRVRDTGVGIPAEEMPRLFERFHRIQNIRSRTYEGSGIGLALVQELVKLHGGTVRAESQLNVGTTFIVSVPLGKDHLPPEYICGRRNLASTTIGAAPFVEEALRWLPEQSVIEDAIELFPENELLPVPCPSHEKEKLPLIFVVDDNTDMRQYLARILAECYNIQTFPDGQAAMDAARKRRPDLVLSDVMMPHLDGFGLVREIRADVSLNTVPIILLSARAGEEARVEGLEQGADDYLIKPFSARELLARVAAHLDMARLRKEASEQIRQSEERFRAVQENSLDHFTILKPFYDDQGEIIDFTYIYQNARAAKTTGHSPKELVGRRMTEIFPTFPQTRFFAMYKLAVETGQVMEFEDSYHADGVDDWFSAKVTPIPEGIAIATQIITERKRAEEELAAAYSQIQSIIDNTPDIVYAFDLEERFVLANTAVANVLNSTPDQMIGKKRHEFMPKKDADWHEANDRQVFEAGRVLEFEEYSHLESRSITWLTKKFPLRDAQGRISAVAGISADITERKRAEEALQKQAELIDLSPDGIITRQLDGTITFWSKGAQSLYGWTSQEAIGQQVHILLKTRFLQPLEQMIEQVQQTGYWSGELTHFTKDGRQVVVQSRWQARFDDQGNMSEILESNVDITERKRAEEALCQAYEELEAQARELQEANETLSESEKRYRLIFDNSMDAIILTDPQGAGKVLSANPAACRLLGWSEEELIGKERDVIFGSESPVVSAFLDERACSGSAKVQITYRRKDGTILIGELSSTLFTDINREPRSVTIIRDITERKRAEEELSHRREMLQQIFDNIPVLLVMWNPHLEQFTLNQYAENVLGWTTADANDGDFMAKVYPDAAYCAEVSAYMQSLATGWREWICTTKNGQHVPIDWANIFLTDDTMIGIGVDLRERKAAEEALRESEERFRMMANAIPQLAWIAKADGYIYWYNERWYAYTGTTPEQMEGWGWQSVHDPAMLPKVLEQWKASIASGKEFDMEFPLRGADGLYRQFLTRGFPLKDAKGQVLQWFGTNTDITERKIREEIQEAINSINQTIHSTLDFDEIMQKTVSEANKVIGSDMAAISLRKDGRWIASYVHGFPEDVIGTEMNDEEEPHAVLAIKTRKPVVINDTFNDERVNRNHMKKWGIRSVLAVPLIIRDEVIGVIFFNCHKSIFAFDDIHVDFATRLSSSLSLALENSRLFKKLETELIERKKAGNELREAYEKVQAQSEELQVFNEELQVQSEELQEANEALHESEKRYRTLAENSPDVITRFDRQNRYMYANPAASEAYGISQDEIIGKTHGELRRNPELAKFLETYQEIVFTTGKKEAVEFHYKSPQGKEYYFNTKIVPEFANGKVISILAISRDITDIKEAEAKLKETLDNLENLVKARTTELEKAYSSLKDSERSLAEAQKTAHIGSWEWNIATNKSYWSDEVYRIFGLNPKEFEPTYNAFLDIVHPEDREYVNHSVKEAFNRKPYDIDYRIMLPNGQERVVYAQGGAIFDDKNTPILMRGVFQDITERKQAEKALANIEIARKQEIHHRIKNNLQVISSLLDLQAEQFRDREDIKDSEVLKAFRESQDRVISMALIHEELYKGGGFDTLNFSPYIEELAENLFLTYCLGNIDISLNMDLEENLFFDMDTAIPLGMIVNELVSNSLKHAFIGRYKGEIRIKLNREESEDCKSTSFILTVSDNGIGIPENLDVEDLDSLGFQLVTTLVDQLDGELELKRNNGTEFTMRFTVTEKNNQASAPAPQQLVE